MLASWPHMLMDQTVKKLHSKREKERDPEREREISSALPVTSLSSEHWVSLPSSYSQQQQTKAFHRKWTTTLFFLFYFHSLACLSAWHTAVCSCFQIRTEDLLEQIIRTDFTVYSAQLHQDNLLLVGFHPRLWHLSECYKWWRTENKQNKWDEELQTVVKKRRRNEIEQKVKLNLNIMAMRCKRFFGLNFWPKFLTLPSCSAFCFATVKEN